MRATRSEHRRADSDDEATFESESDPRAVPLDEAFALLRSRRRRAIVRRLQATPTTDIGDLAEHVAAQETDTSRDQLGSKGRKRVYISLYQSHLPRLADAGVVAYDSNRGVVERLPAADALDRQLGRFRAYESKPALDRLQYAGICVQFAVVAGAFGLPPLDALAPAWWATVSVFTLVTLAVATSVGARSRPDPPG